MIECVQRGKKPKGGKEEVKKGVGEYKGVKIVGGKEGVKKGVGEYEGVKIEGGDTKGLRE